MTSERLFRGAATSAVLILSSGAFVACASVWGFDDLSVGDASADGEISAYPQSPAQSIAFANDSTRCDEVSGAVAIEPPPDDTDITGYALYFGTTPTTKLGASIVIVPGAGHTYKLPSTTPPKGATYLLAYAVNGAGENPRAVATPLHQATYVDLSATRASGSWGIPSPVIDPLNDKLLVVAPELNRATRPSLFACRLDGTSCSYFAMGTSLIGGSDPIALFDDSSVSGRLRIVMRQTNGPVVWNCAADGQSCSEVTITANQATDQPDSIAAVLDMTNHRLLVATNNIANGYRPALFVCGADGVLCTHFDISAGQGQYSGGAPSTNLAIADGSTHIAATIDPVNKKLLVITADGTNGNRLSLFRCDLDGSGCVHKDISGGAEPGSGYNPSVTIDAVGQKLIVVTTNIGGSGAAALTRCALDGTSCTHLDVTAGGINGRADDPTVVVDDEGSHLYVVAAHQPLARCSLDGATCTAATWPGLDVVNGTSPKAILDRPNARLLVSVQSNATKTVGVGLITRCLD